MNLSKRTRGVPTFLPAREVFPITCDWRESVLGPHRDRSPSSRDTIIALVARGRTSCPPNGLPICCQVLSGRFDRTLVLGCASLIPGPRTDYLFVVGGRGTW